MLTEICAYLKNWFTRTPNGRELPRHKGEFTIHNGTIEGLNLLEGQCFRIVGSLLNDGVYVHSQKMELKDETFNGEIWEMAVPVDVRKIAIMAAMWEELYGKADSPALSPYNSESFGGYSYSKSGTNEGSGGWQSVYGGQLTRYKKL